MAGYTLSWNDRQFTEINKGKRFPAKFDNRHKFNIIANWKNQAQTGVDRKLDLRNR